MTTYSGHVEPGGEAISRFADVGSGRVEIRKFSVGPMDNNVYVLRDPATDEALIVDAANDADRILSEVEGLDVVGIVTTHGHADHWQALAEVATATGGPVWLHPADADLVPLEAEHGAADGDEIDVGGFTVRLIHTPGHTAGSTCILLGQTHLFTGDTLFPGGPGNTFGNAEAFATIMRSLEERVFVLDDDTWVYPGHGDDTTLGRERPSLTQWRERGW